MKNRKEKTEYLLQSIGEIDDALLNEAMSYKPARRNRSYKIAIIAACLAVVLAIGTILPLSIGVGSIVGIAGILLNIGDSSNEAHPPADNEQNASIPTAFDSVIESARDERYLISLDELESIEGPVIVWQYDGEDAFYAKKISQGELDEVEKTLGCGYLVGEKSPQTSCKVWVADEKGIFRTPHLRANRGNEDVGIFDYEAEIVPSDEFTNCISGILE